MKKWIPGSIILITILYWFGPKPEAIKWDFSMPEVPIKPGELEEYISSNESKHKVKPDNGARIIWADSSHRKTEFSVIYLHGFTASQKEGDPIHRQFARSFGCNLYLSRLSDHGIDTTDALLNFTGERWWQSVKEALAIGKMIGNKVIIISTSTGGTAAIMLASHYPDDVFALLNLSPNIELKNPAAFILNNPWGLQIARINSGGKYRIEPDDETSSYWSNTCRLEATVQLEQLLEETMKKETFQKIKQPVLTLCYFKNEEEQDPTVKVSAMMEMHRELGTIDTLKSIIRLPDVGAHVMGSDMLSKDVKGVYLELEKFAINTLRLKKV